jgi:hypothetical protein
MPYHHYREYSLSRTLLAAGRASTAAAARGSNVVPAAALTADLAVADVIEAAALSPGQLLMERLAIILVPLPLPGLLRQRVVVVGASRRVLCRYVTGGELPPPPPARLPPPRLWQPDELPPARSCFLHTMRSQSSSVLHATARLPFWAISQA